jgi:hypothetical protein
MSYEIKKQLCEVDFYGMLRNALSAAGGGENIEIYKKKTLEECVNTFANNGLRIVYMPDRHIKALQIIWDAKPTSVAFDKDAITGVKVTPTKRQLLCDQLDVDGE